MAFTPSVGSFFTAPAAVTLVRLEEVNVWVPRGYLGKYWYSQYFSPKTLRTQQSLIKHGFKAFRVTKIQLGFQGILGISPIHIPKCTSTSHGTVSVLLV